MGFFIWVPTKIEQKRDLVTVRKWDASLQQFTCLAESEECAYQEGVLNFDFDRHLGAFPSENHSQWIGLSNYIDDAVISRL